MMDVQEIGGQLRGRRAAAGRTVASVAMDAGLSVPYVANLENGRGNPTLSALSRLASALGLKLTISLEPEADQSDSESPNMAEIPLALVRLGRTKRFRAVTEMVGGQLDVEPRDFAAHVLGSLANVTAFHGDLAEADCWRLIDALTLIAICPAAAEPALASTPDRAEHRV